MPNPIKPKRSHTSSAQPTVADLAVNELAVNWTDGKLFTRSPSDAIVSWTLGGSGGGGGSGSIVEYATESAFPATGAATTLYIATDVSRAYRWTGSVYVEVGVDGGGGSSSWSKVDVPASATSTGSIGQYAHGGGYFYLATGSNQWERTALSTWLPDAYFSNVSMLLHMDGNGSTFVDSSGTPKTITAFGNATQSTTQSKFGGKSAYFDGSGDYLSGPTIDLSTGDWVIEGWFRVANGSAFQSLVCLDPGSASAGMHIHTYFDGQLYFNNSLAGAISGGTVPSNTWFHVAGVRSSGTIRLYLNGSLIGTSGQSFGSGTFKIGISSDTSTAMNGFADEIRVTLGTDRGFNGATITVPTEAFPNA